MFEKVDKLVKDGGDGGTNLGRQSGQSGDSSTAADLSLLSQGLFVTDSGDVTQLMAQDSSGGDNADNQFNSLTVVNIS
jgi:hypothetical protein